MKALYNVLFKRTSTFALTIMASVFFFERGVDVASTTIFETVNKGKLWKDIKDKYE
ncbi:cytochrome b-c1 complex subunit 9 [Eurosta solidaginis]|uniref:cytochrome b-c1 complex subunit 9 n=1 Tax=Eurosta solidaginis TaxID=178769 RepID=UPI0035314BB7